MALACHHQSLSSTDGGQRTPKPAWMHEQGDTIRMWILIIAFGLSFWCRGLSCALVFLLLSFSFYVNFTSCLGFDDVFLHFWFCIYILVLFYFISLVRSPLIVSTCLLPGPTCCLVFISLVVGLNCVSVLYCVSLCNPGPGSVSSQFSPVLPVLQTLLLMSLSTFLCYGV